MTTKIAKIETIRLDLGDCYCDITPSTDSGYYDFWLFKKAYGVSHFMFSCKAIDENEAVEIANANIGEYISLFDES